MGEEGVDDNALIKRRNAGPDYLFFHCFEPGCAVKPAATLIPSFGSQDALMGSVSRPTSPPNTSTPTGNSGALTLSHYRSHLHP